MKIEGIRTDEAILREVGGRLAGRRLARNWTQGEVAEKAGVSKRTVERMESGEVAGRLTGLVRILRALDLLERLDLLVPEVGPEPVEELRMAGRRRKRAAKARDGARREWTWGDK